MLKRTRAALTFVAGLSTLLVGLCPLSAAKGTGSAAAKPSHLVRSPQVVHTGTGPTGYIVTFRYVNPHAKRIQIKGEWSFERPWDLPQLSPTPNHPIVEGQGLLPPQWRPGDVPLQKPNSTSPNFPVADMKKGEDGVWTYTTPLPSGVFTYSFIVDCYKPQVSKCKLIADPANLPWTQKEGITDSSLAHNSQVYVPSDPRFGTVNYWWQGPATGTHGKLVHLTYPSPGHVTPKDSNYIVVYTPPGYSPHRAKPYPTLYLSHGGGENELGWSTQGDVANILDNLIDTGQIQPIVVVMPNGMGFPPSTFDAAYDHDMVANLIPFVEAHYHVSTSAKDRAFSGLSMGGMLTNSFMIQHPEVFQYYGMMSAGLPPENARLTTEQATALKGKSIWVGGGWQDAIFAVGFRMRGRTIHTGPAREVSTLVQAGVPVTTDFVDGGHEWYVWRILLRDFLTRTAFLPLPYAVWE